ncbi:HIT-like protein [Aaosphaeria arxii CBS 175.79]|uniref:Aprataxin-like protein n=1 Tax=Aaosphaeria arxii CBS 175.79 TaxID=1450172 RepID=A0A6A5XEP8_9PLEO|nr:HIT-like protein [Aaosphaeria arxii CBS 175.79]KAF2011568.1 HIT-like protein [Aaosphaeria arxii CBS 175.79]
MTAAKKPKPAAPVAAQAPPKRHAFDPRHGLGVYIEHPEKNPEGLVVEYDDDWVVIRDKYPKASVHLLLIPRDPEIYSEHPLHALSKRPELLADAHKRVDRLKRFVASDLRRMYGKTSAADQPYQTALEELMTSDKTPPPASERSERDEQLPAGRDWMSEVVAGVHTHPSMNHMHIHILSRESHSPCLKHKKHYLSFHSSFFVGLDELPLDEERDRKRFHPGDWPQWDMLCWRCGKNFGQKFAALKRHIEEEFEEWKRE